MKLTLFVLLFSALTVCAAGKEYECHLVHFPNSNDEFQMQSVQGGDFISFVIPEQEYSKYPCVYSETFGTLDNRVWVDGKCRGLFKACFGTNLRDYRECRSFNSEPHWCFAGGRIRSIRLTKKFSHAPCRRGLDYRTAGPWIIVLNNCAARFDFFIG